MGACSSLCYTSGEVLALRRVELETKRAQLKATQEEASRKDAEWACKHPEEARVRIERQHAQLEARQAELRAMRQADEIREKRMQMDQKEAVRQGPDPFITFATGAVLGMMLT